MRTKRQSVLRLFTTVSGCIGVAFVACGDGRDTSLRPDGGAIDPEVACTIVDGACRSTLRGAVCCNVEGYLYREDLGCLENLPHGIAACGANWEGSGQGGPIPGDGQNCFGTNGFSCAMAPTDGSAERFMLVVQPDATIALVDCSPDDTSTVVTADLCSE